VTQTTDGLEVDGGQAQVVPVEGKADEGHKPHHGKHKEHEKLGFVIRFLYVYYGLWLLFGLAYFALTSRDVIVYDVNTIYMFIGMVIYGICFWLIAKRLRFARTAIVVANVIDLSLQVLNLISGELSLVGFAVNAAIHILLIAYFVRGERPRKVLYRDLDANTKRDVSMPRINQLAFWRNLLMYYCVFAVVGHWMEAGFCMLIRWGVVAGSYDPSNTSLWRDWLYPFPPDGVGFVACVLLLYPIKNWLQDHIHVRFAPLVISFVINGLVCVLIELCFGLVVNPHFELWNYSDMFCNFMGQICLQNGIGFAMISTLITWVLYPFIERQLDRVSKDGMAILAPAVFVFYAVLQCLYLVNPPSLG
jgi:hypothetical protein